MNLKCFFAVLSMVVLQVRADFATYSFPLKGVNSELGSVMSYSVIIGNSKTNNQTVNKGLSIRVGRTNAADICFDMETLRYAAGWTDGTLDVSKSLISKERGSSPSSVKGTILFQTDLGPGWGTDGDFADPRTNALGHLPEEWAKYKGMYRSGSDVVLSYSVGHAQVLDLPGFESAPGIECFTRTLSIREADKPLGMLLCDATNLTDSAQSDNPTVIQFHTNRMVFAVSGAADAKITILDQRRVVLELAKPLAHAVVKIFMASVPDKDFDFAAFMAVHSEVRDPETIAHAAKAQWPQKIVTTGTLGQGNAYVMDTLALPEKNPWNSWMRMSALDFFSDGRMAVSTMGGDVWIVSGIDEKLEKITWKRYAAGLYEPLGLRVVDDVVYVLGRDQVTRLHDTNKDGEADFYENFNNDRPLAPIYHAFAFDLQTDSKGDFYFVVGGNLVAPDLAGHRALFRLTKDGKRIEKVASGFRAPNGMGIGPNDEILCSDNQGHWTPSSRISRIKPGGFYGYPGDPRDKRTMSGVLPTSYDAPIIWLPMSADNSSGGQVFANSEKFGPLANHWMHTSYGKCWAYYLMTEEVNGEMQAAAVRFPFTFASGIQRGRISPKDGQVYVCGLKGWQTSAGHDGCLQRIRYTGALATLPVSFHVKPTGIDITFSAPLEKTSATDTQNYSVAQWNYLWSPNYGSDSYSVADPKKKAEDVVPVESVSLSADAKTISIKIAKVQPVMQMRVKFEINGADGKPVTQEIFNTINKVPDK